VTARAYRRLLALNVGIAAYWWALIAYIAINASEEGSFWPFLGVPLVLLGQSWLWRTLRRDARFNSALSREKRAQWEVRLKLWTPISSFAYLWMSLRRTTR